MDINIPYQPAKAISIAGSRAYSEVQYIIIHYTGISNDTAENEAKFFATGNTRAAGAHFFVGQNGHVVQSIKMSQIAKSVPQKKQGYSGGAWYLKKCVNRNSVSIELCDNLDKDPSLAQINATRELVAYIRSVCPNASKIIRHYDVTGKMCPARMVNEKKWDAFVAEITKPIQEKEVEDLTREETIAVIREVVPGIVEEAVAKVIRGEGTTLRPYGGEYQRQYEKAVALGITDGTRPGGLMLREEGAVMNVRVIETREKEVE